MKKFLLGLAILFLLIIIYIAYGYLSLFFEDSFVHFIKNNNLYPVRRHIPGNDSKYREIYRQISQGPNVLERLAGVYTAIPKDIQLMEVNVSGDTIYLDFFDDIEKWNAGAHNVRLAIAQIVFSYTEIPGISKVAFSIEGKRKRLIIGNDGYIIDRPLSRADVNSISKE